MTSFVITTDTITPRSLDFAELGFISETGFLHTNSYAVTLGQLSYLSNAGTLLSLAAAGRVLGNDATIHNSGLISGPGDGVEIAATGTDIVNTGTIAVRRVGIYFTVAPERTSIVNSGDITARFGAINHDVSSGGAVSITNTGLMASSFEVIIVRYAQTSLTNSGTISATAGPIAVVLSDEADTVLNEGTVLGNIVLGDGADRYSGSGSVAGVIDGQGGDDTLSGGDSADRIRGGAGEDDLAGGAGGDTLDGGSGADLLDGGDGKDWVTYASAQAGVRIDLVDPLFSSGDARGDDYESIEIFEGSAFADSLYGSGGNDILLGGDGNDLLQGRAGADLLRGGRGDDRFIVDSARDRILERAGQGIDTVEASVSFSLLPGAEVEVLQAGDAASIIALHLTGSDTANTITGNAGANSLSGQAGNDVLTGLAGADTLAGGPGRDTLTGGAGADVFLFNSTLPTTSNDSSNYDLVTDFVPVDDVIHLSRAVFRALPLGALSADALQSGSVPSSPASRILYASDGSLLYDPDGTGAAVGVYFGQLAGRPAITAADFLVVA